MAIVSMTGFSRAEGSDVGLVWFWEARSVNGRGLDLRFRFPPGYDGLEGVVREAAAKRFTRGSINVSLTVRRESMAPDIRLNEHVLARAIEAAKRVSEMARTGPASVDALLAVKGVLELAEPGDDATAQGSAREAMLTGLTRALDDLAAARGAEGRRLGAALASQLRRIDDLVAAIEVAPARRPEAIRAKLADQVNRLVEASSSLDPARLHQEAVLLATRADVEEELIRLKGHITAARELLSADAAVGRRLDFLAQEFNREANTICAKSNDGDITRAGLDLKVVIDQFREQVQNVE